MTMEQGSEQERFVCCGRQFASHKGMRIHQGRTCMKIVQKCRSSLRKTRASVAQEETHSGNTNTIDQPETAKLLPVKWPNSTETTAYREFEIEVLKALKKKRTLEDRLKQLSDTIYGVGADKFGVITPIPRTSQPKRDNRRTKKLQELRAEKKQLRKQWLAAKPHEKEGLKALYDDIKERHRLAARAERRLQRKKERKRCRQRFLKAPFQFAKDLFAQSKSGTLSCTKEELDNHLKETYCDPRRDEPLANLCGIPRPSQPAVTFDMSYLKKKEVDDFVAKARAKSKPGQDCVPYKVYKRCPQLRFRLYKLLKEAWKTKTLAEKWCRAEGIYIPKEEDSKDLSQFRQISLLNVDGKIFNGIIAKRMMTFLLANGYIDETVQKAGLPGTPGCIEHVNTIWESIQDAKREKSDLTVVWLDLANAFGSVPHQLMQKAMDHFWIPAEVQKLLMTYYDKFIMRFSTGEITTDWQRLEIGVAAGCTISVIVFLLCMELILRGTNTDAITAIRSPKKAFMDDIAILTKTVPSMKKMLSRLDELITWARMKFRASKSRSVTFKDGKQRSVKFKVAGETMPTLAEKPVKSLGRLYEGNLTDRHKGVEIHKEAEEGLKTIHKTLLPGKYKAWILQFAFYPRILWPLNIYEVGLSRVSKIEQRCHVFIRKWLQLPKMTASAALYKNNGVLELPTASLVEQFKCGKVRTILMLRDSRDHTISCDPPRLNTLKQWNAEEATDAAVAALHHKDIVGAVCSNSRGLGFGTFKPSCKMTTQERRKAVVSEVKFDEASKRNLKLVQSSVQGQCTYWQENVIQRKLTWNEIWQWEPARLSFLIQSTYDTLPSPANLVRWKILSDNKCKCGQRGTMRHILSNCPIGLNKRYLWRHNKILDPIHSAIKEKVDLINQGKLPLAKKLGFIRFCKRGMQPSSKALPKVKDITWKGNWKVTADLDNNLVFPVVHTSQRPDLVVWNEAEKIVKIVELTVSWETNIDGAYDRKSERYEDLCNRCEEVGWAPECLPIEVGARGYIGRRLPALLTGLGFNSKEKNNLIKEIQSTAEKASFWIWLKREDTTWND